MEVLLGKLQENFRGWKELMKKVCRKNKLDISISSSFTPIKMKALYKRLQVIYDRNPEKAKTTWVENQLKAYQWALVVRSAFEDRLIDTFDQQDWDYFANIFQHKDQAVLEYEALRLVRGNSKSKTWNPEEQKILTAIIEETQSNRWNEIARRLFDESDKRFFRSGKQCRERWFNHLDSSKKHGSWTEQEDFVIFEFIREEGKKWSEISKKLGGNRTEHMVKNRYKSLLLKTAKCSNTRLKEFELIDMVLKKYSTSMTIDCHIHKETSEDKLYLTPQKDQSIKIENAQGYDLICQEENMVLDLDDDPVLKQLVRDSRGKSHPVHTPKYELQQVFTPFYMNYQGMTTNLTPTMQMSSPSLPFFLNSSFSHFEKNKDLFLKDK